MSTMILDPVFSYFSPFLRNEAAQAHCDEDMLRGLSASIAHLYLRIVMQVVLGAALFLVSALPTLFLFLITNFMSKDGLANTSAFALMQLAAQAFLGIDLLLFLVYCGRTLFRAVRQL